MAGTVDVVIPVGPGHEKCAADAEASVDRARKCGFEVCVAVVEDHGGQIGRSAARNRGAEAGRSDWLLFLDADDVLDPGAFEILRDHRDRDAVWGRYWQEHDYRPEKIATTHHLDRPLSSFDDLLEHGPYCGLSVEFFLRRKLFESIGGFVEVWDIAEDIELIYAVCAHGTFAKDDRRLALVRRWQPRASGPRGYASDLKFESPESVLARKRAHRVLDFWRARGRRPFSALERIQRLTGDDFYG